MPKRSEHSRRDFLQGRAAARVVTERAQQLLESATSVLRDPTPTANHLLVQLTRRAMACEFAIQWHETDRSMTDAAMAALDLIEDIEAQLTIYRDHSEVIDLNRWAAEQPVVVDPQLFALLEQAQQIYLLTDHAFDITSGPLSRTWGFLERAGRMPADEEIAAALACVGFDRVQLDPASQSVRFTQPGVEINLNSIGKGYALDRAAEQMAEQGAKDFLWHGGRSSVLARGVNRNDPHQAWTIGLRHPWHPEQYLAQLFLRDRGLGTAGGATQFFEHEGRRLSHILDPRSGRPVEGVLSATALAPTAAEADALATAFFVMGEQATAAYCEQHTNVAAVLVVPASGEQVRLATFGLSTDDWAREN